MKMDYVPGKGTGGNGSNHAGQSKHNEGGQGKQTKGPCSYPATAISAKDTKRADRGKQNTPKIFG